MSEDSSKSGSATVIKKYANRRLYNTATSTYVTLEDLSQMVRGGTEFIVYDAKTGDDITRSVLTQIIFEEENKGAATNLLPLNFLRQLIKVYGDSMQGVVPGYLEMSLDNLMKQQDDIRKQMMESWSAANPMAANPMTNPMGNPLGAMPPGFPGSADMMKGLEEQTKRNMQMFQDAMRNFNPFFATMTEAMQRNATKAAHPPKPEAKPEAKPATDLDALKDQLAAMQAKLDKMSGN